MAAFSGESEARNKYTYFASVAKKEGYQQIAAIFEATANYLGIDRKALSDEIQKGNVTGQVLDFTKRLTEKEARFIDYAREHNINFDDLMEG